MRALEMADRTAPDERRPGLILQNEPEAPPGLFAEWLENRGLPYTLVETWDDGVPDDPREYGWICALGAEASATQDEPGWIPDEIELLRRAVSMDVPVLGICFGGQALARALGAEVRLARRRCAGWYQVKPEAGVNLLSPGPWVHFNRDCFGVPQGFRKLGEGPNGPAGYVRGPHMGLQFHPEVSPEIVGEWLAYDEASLIEDGFDLGEIRRDTDRHAEDARRQALALFGRWWELA